MQEGHTFSAAADAPRFRLEEAEPVDYPADSLFVNEFGTWLLVPVSAGH